MKKSFLLLVKCSFLLTLATTTIACKHKQPKYDGASSTEGTIHISVDPSFEPVIKQQLFMFHDTYKKTNIIASYKSEADCFKDLFSGKADLIITSRELSNEEQKYVQSKGGLTLPNSIMAWDAVCVVINKKSTDTTFTRAQLAKLLQSNDPKSPPMVMDGNNLTSTTRFMMDSVMKSNAFGKNVVAADNPKAVLDYVSEYPNAIGFVGSSWMDFDNPTLSDYSKNLTVAKVQCERGVDSGSYFYPSQATINNMHYPFFRSLIAISGQNSLGLAKSFYNWMTLERGQLIFRRALLDPAIMNFSIRSVNLKK